MILFLRQEKSEYPRLFQWVSREDMEMQLADICRNIGEGKPWAGWETEFGEVKFSSILFELVISWPGPFSTNYTLSLFLADGCSHCVWFPLYFRACLIISFTMASTWECPVRHYCWSVTSSVRLMTSLMHSSMLEISLVITSFFFDTRFHMEIMSDILDLFQSIRQVWCQVFI